MTESQPPSDSPGDHGRAVPEQRAPEVGPYGIAHLLSGAREELERVTPQQALEMQRGGAVLVDIRPESDRLTEGEIPGALTVDRIVLEWRLDPSSPDRLTGMQPDRRVVLVCNEGYASSLAAAQARELGLGQATDLVGGFRAWAQAGLPVVAHGHDRER